MVSQPLPSPKDSGPSEGLFYFTMLDLTQQIRTLGLYQPFATLMLHGKIETRFVNYPKKSPFPLGPYLIYSTIKAYAFYEAEELMGDQVEEARRLFGIEFQYGRTGTINPVSKEFLLGHALCVCNLVNIIDPITPETNKGTFVSYIPPCTRRRVGLVFENVERIEPFPFKGRQGVGFLSDSDKAKIKFLSV